MTDGFHRLADTYGVYTQDDLVRRCRSAGLAGLVQELRAWEAARAGLHAPLAVKNADDASAVVWTPDGVDSNNPSIRPGPASARATEEPA